MSPSSGQPDKDELGELGEDLAARYLRRNGYEIIERNYGFAGGEIDIIATEGEILVFVEVKARSSTNHGPPELAVDYRKQKLLQRTAERFTIQRKLRRPVIRYDIVTLVLNGSRGQPEIKLFKNAF